MNCKYHEKEAVSKCKICGADLCEDCAKFQEKNGSCPDCAKLDLDRSYKNQRNGLMYNILSTVCAVGFLVLYLISFAKLTLVFKIVGGIIIGLLFPLTIVMLTMSIIGIKKAKKMLNYKNINRIKNLKKE